MLSSYQYAEADAPAPPRLRELIDWITHSMPSYEQRILHMQLIQQSQFISNSANYYTSELFIVKTL